MPPSPIRPMTWYCPRICPTRLAIVIFSANDCFNGKFSLQSIIIAYLFYVQNLSRFYLICTSFKVKDVLPGQRIDGTQRLTDFSEMVGGMHKHRHCAGNVILAFPRIKTFE